MAGLNKVMLIGNLGKDPELRKTPSGTSVGSFSLATTERYQDKSGTKQENTEWHSIVVWGKLAELAHQYLKKGRPVYVEGRIATRSWDDKDGNKKYKTEIIASALQFLGSPVSGESSGGGDSSFPRVNTEVQDNSFPTEPMGPGPGASSVAEDDLPF